MRFVRESDSTDPEDARTVEIQPEDLLEFRPVRRYLDDTTSTVETGRIIEPTYRWSAAEWAEWALCWFGPATAVAAALWLIAMVCAHAYH